MNERLEKLAQAGVSIWLDDLSRDRIETGNLAEVMEEKSVVGVTTNPTIFASAIADGERYDEQVRGLVAEGATTSRVIFELTTEDVRNACDILAPVFDGRPADGRVSIEVEPDLANDTEATIASAQDLWQAVDRPNALIKIPATQEGLAAITTSIAQGISVNVTLIFGVDRYREVMDAYLSGLEAARDNELDLTTIQSVASFFVSRVDGEIDQRLDDIGTDEALALRGKAAVANARLAYAAYLEVLQSDRWTTLAEAGANAQRPLWASTGVKNEDYPDTLYVTELVVADTVNTMPEKTMDAFGDHGEVAGDTVTGRDDEAQRVMDDLAGVGIDLADVLSVLEDEGVSKFKKVMVRARRDSREADGSGLVVSAYRLGLRHREGYEQILDQLVTDRVASRIAAQDATLWGAEAEEEAAKRLSWVDSPTASQSLIPDIDSLRAELSDAGLEHVVLCGMGGSSLAPEVICAGSGLELTVVDSSDPDFVRRVLEDRLQETVVVVSSKSGGTVETDSQRRAFEKAFTDAGIDPGERIIVVTDPGSPLEESAREAGYRVFLADPEVGGRYSALTAFGLVPSGLAGVDVEALLRQAQNLRPELEEDSTDNPALRLGALLGAAHEAGVDKLVLAPDDEAEFFSFGDWIEQLVAESTGKHERGILPVVVPSTEDPNVAAATPDCIQVRFGAESMETKPPALAPSGWSAVLGGEIGGQMLLWEYATAVAGRVIGINPFDQPDVESAKSAARDMLDSGGDAPEPLFTDDGFSVYASEGWLPEGIDSVGGGPGRVVGSDRRRPRVRRGAGLPRSFCTR